MGERGRGNGEREQSGGGGEEGRRRNGKGRREGGLREGGGLVASCTLTDAELGSLSSCALWGSSRSPLLPFLCCIMLMNSLSVSRISLVWKV